MTIRVPSALLLAAAVLLPESSAMAQRANRFGVIAGVNFSKFGGDADGANGRMGLVAGIFSRNEFTDQIGIEAQVLYSQQGIEGNFDDEVDGALKLSYLKVPVLLTWAAPTRGDARVRPRVFAGPAFGFKAACKVSASAGAASLSVPCEDIDLEFKSFEVSAVGGIGVDISQITLQLRYDLGLTDIDKSNLASIKNRVLSILAGYYFTLR